MKWKCWLLLWNLHRGPQRSELRRSNYKKEKKTKRERKRSVKRCSIGGILLCALQPWDMFILAFIYFSCKSSFTIVFWLTGARGRDRGCVHAPLSVCVSFPVHILLFPLTFGVFGCVRFSPTVPLSIYRVASNPHSR